MHSCIPYEGNAMIIDTHTHLFADDQAAYPIHPDAMYRPTTPGSAELLRTQMDEAGVDRVFTISPWPYQWDNSYALDALKKHRSWLAVGVLVDPHDPKGPDTLSDYVEKGVCGLRIQGKILGLDPLDDPRTTPLWSKAADLGITLDVNAAQNEYPQVANRAKEFREMPIVLDHCGYISEELAPAAPTVEPVLRMSEYPNVYAKLSFLGGASSGGYPCEDVHWMVREIIDAFGAERCIYGSNFPTKQYNTKLTYDETIRLFSEAVDLSDSEREWVIGRTAQKLWRWG
jgi:predicted TIM-barrel fold metal-dependent hydrolase